MDLPAILKDWKHGFLMVTGSILLTGAVFGIGYQQGAEHATQEMIILNNAKADEVPAIILAEDVKDQTDRTNRSTRDTAREHKLLAEVDALKASNSDLQAILNEKDTPVPDCYLTIGNVRLLNAGKTFPGSDNPEGASDPTSGAFYQEPDASTISCEDLIADDLDVSSRYNALKLKHDATVDWMTQELIEPMQAKAASE